MGHRPSDAGDPEISFVWEVNWRVGAGLRGYRYWWLRDKQKVEGGFCGLDVFVSFGERDSAVFGEAEIEVQEAVAAEPKVLYTDLRPNAVRGADDSTTAEVMKLFAAAGIHALGDHFAPLELLR